MNKNLELFVGMIAGLLIFLAVVYGSFYILKHFHVIE